jgi:hypothetical protein
VSRRSCIRSISAMISSSSAVWRPMHWTIGAWHNTSVTNRPSAPLRGRP